MTKRIISLLLIAVLALSLLAACGNDGPLTTDDAKQVVLEDLGIKEKDVDSLDVHITTAADGTACYLVYNDRHCFVGKSPRPATVIEL